MNIDFNDINIPKPYIPEELPINLDSILFFIRYFTVKPRIFLELVIICFSLPSFSS